MKLTKKLGSIILSVVMALGLSFGVAAPVFAEDNPYEPTTTVEYNGVTFGRATEAYNTTSVGWNGQVTVSVYEGMPLFDGEEEHLDAYVDLLLEEMGEEGIIARAAGTAYGTVPETGQQYRIPSLGKSADVGNDGGTQWPNQFALSQSWNTDLVKEAGYQFGKEIRSESATGSIAGGSITANAAQVDPHMNPLAGRYDEGYGEDPFMSGVFTDAWGDGMSGRSKTNQSLYYQSIALVKHWATYQGEFFRSPGSYNVSARTFYEYWAEAVNRPVQNGSVLGIMSSYGRLNYVPSTSAFTQTYIQSIAPDGLSTECDFMSEYAYTASAGWMGGGWSNGYDLFYSSSMYDRDALMILAGHRQGGNAMAAVFDTMKYDHAAVITKDIEAGVLGLTLDDVIATVRPGLVQLVRAGVCDERDANGQPKYYPFIVEEAHAANDVANHYHNDKEIQDVALQAAEESIVLLKNENDALPLAKNKAIDLYGTFAHVYQYGLYSTALNQDVNTGYASYSQQYPGGKNLLEALDAGKYEYVFSDGRQPVKLKLGGQYVAAQADGTVYLTSDAKDAGTIWEIEDWGQDAYSFFSQTSGKWLDADISNPNNAEQSRILSKNFTATYDANFKGLSWGQIINSDFPDFFEIKTFDGKQYIKGGSKWNVTDFGANYTVPGLMGWYIENKDGVMTLDYDDEIPEGGSRINTAPDREEAGFDESFEFVIEPVEETFTKANTAVIVVGAVYNGIAGEGIDRFYLNLGDGMVEQALDIAKAYKAAGKKTVLIVKADFPVIMEDFQNSSDIDAILFMPMGGQYEAYAMTEVLYGDVNPSGRLTSTWYPTQDVLPELTPYSVPIDATVSIGEGAGNPAYAMGPDGPIADEDNLDDNKAAALANVPHVTFEDIGVITDTSNSDLQDNRLSYMYYDGPVTYPFGYGLGYSDFTIGNSLVPTEVDAEEPFEVGVDVSNDGKYDGAEVIQVYVAKPDSAYGSAAPLMRLAGFTKVEIPAGGRTHATITIDPIDFALWDVNAEQYVVEDGDYVLCIAKDASLEDAIVAEITVSGKALANLEKMEDVNVWEHSFDTSDLQFVEYSKGRTLAGAADDAVRDDTFAVNSTCEGAYAALYGIDLDKCGEIIAHVASWEDGNKIEFRQDSPDGEVIATIEFDHTEAITEFRPLTSEDPADQKYAGKYTELGYEEVKAPLVGTGIHNVYIVFMNADARLGSIDFVPQLYPDVEADAWYYPTVSNMYYTKNENGSSIMSGYQDGTFGPVNPLARAEFAVMMHRLANEPEAEFDADAFPDVAEGDFFATACMWAKATGVIKGYENGYFGSTDPITREQLATILYRYAKDYLELDVLEAEEKGDLSPFSDKDAVSEFALNPMKWATGAGIILGNADGTLDPQGNANRAHAATMFTRFIDYIDTFSEGE